MVKTAKLQLEHKCKNCQWWHNEDGNYCLLKDLYTHTDAEQECDEMEFVALNSNGHGNK